MIDLHTHILSDTDDGSGSFEESVALLYEAKKAGFSGVVCTPHYMQQFYERDVNYINNKIQELSLDSKRIGIHLYQGNEIYISNEVCKFIENNKVTTINNSRYVLLELALEEKPIKNTIEIIEDIIKKEYIPIIAYPERYPYIQKNIEYAKELLRKGALFQANYASIDGYYGSQVKKTLIKLLKGKMIQLLGTDVHKKRTMYINMPKYIKALSKYLSEDEIHELSYKNPIKVIHDEKITVDTDKL